MKKLFTVLFIGILLIGMVSCKGVEPEKGKEEEKTLWKIL